MIESTDSKDLDSASEAFRLLYRIADRLRSPEGCPWDKVQTPSSMRPNLIEETFEAVDAITRSDSADAKEELGDILFDLLLVLGMYRDSGDFTPADAIQDVAEKMVRRHPHVDFSGIEGLEVSAQGEDLKNSSVEQVFSRWNDIKNNVEGRKKDVVLAPVPNGFPPLLKACKYLKKAASQGFKWPSADYAADKVREELLEVKEAAREDDKDHLEDELGDLLFSAVCLSMEYGICADAALERACRKFRRRYSYVESGMKNKSNSENSNPLEEMEALWKEAKKKGL